jgi:hypothetical protein
MTSKRRLPRKIKKYLIKQMNIMYNKYSSADDFENHKASSYFWRRYKYYQGCLHYKDVKWKDTIYHGNLKDL